MTQSDFDQIIFGSLDHLAGSKQYFKSKRKFFDIESDEFDSEFASGLRESFERINLPFQTTSTETLIKQNRIKRSGGEKVNCDSLKKLSRILDAYLRTIEKVVEPVHESSQPIPPNCIKSYTEQWQKRPEIKKIMGFIENESSINFTHKITKNKDGFPIDEKGNFVHSIDDQGNCIIFLVNHENIVFSVTDKQQVHKAAKLIAEYLSKNFSLNLENELHISVKTEKVYTVEPAILPTIGIYFDSISKTLNYLGSVYGINFEYLIYIDFKETTNNTFIAAKTGLYNGRALKKSVKFAKMWFVERDKIYLQKRELFKDSQSKFALTEAGTPQLTETKTEQEFNNLLKAISSVCVDIIENPKDNYELFESKNSDFEDREDKRTRRICSKLKPLIEHFIDSQHKTGLSGTDKKKREGTPDFAIIKKDKTKLTIGEALNFRGINSKGLGKPIKGHLNKLINDYNKSRIDNLLSLIYFETGQDFYRSFENYLKEFNIQHSNTEIVDISKDFIENSDVVKIARSIHSYSSNCENKFSIYHFYIDFSGE